MMQSTLPKIVPPTLEWIGDVAGHLRLIDQTLLPTEVRFRDCHDLPTVWEAIKSLRVRGAPAIGIAAAYGVVIGVRHPTDSRDSCIDLACEAVDYLATSRPTAVNLFWALERMKTRALELRDCKDGVEFKSELLAEARAIHDEDRQMCRAIGRYGAELLQDNWGLLTHCNAGGLATSEYGPALAVFYSAHDSGKRLRVFADETRPLLQGARLTAWELQQHGLNVTLICDSMAAKVMSEGRIQAVVVGADRIAANGDAANKIGTYGVAVLAAAHNIPFYVAAPSTTFDLSIASGDDIPIEERDPREITHAFGRETAPEGIKVYNPAFDVTPARLIRALITERGVIDPVTPAQISKVLG